MNARRRRAHLTLAAIALALAGAWLRVDGTEPQPRWRRFRWFAATFGDERVERAALLVPVRLAGLAGEHDLQLDLGSSQTLLHGGSIHDVAPSFPLRAGATAVSGTMAGVPVAAEPVHVLAGFRATVTREAHMPTVGTLGLAFFERRVLVLDYPGRRFMVLADGAPIPPGLARRARFFPIVRRNGKLYVPIDIDGKAQTGAFFDTGASAFALVTSTRDWRSLTGLQGDEPSLQRRTGSSWDTEITLVGGAMRGRIALGPAVLRQPVVWHTTDPRFSLDAWPDTTAFFGNELFADRFVVIVDIARSRLGLAASDLAARDIPAR